MSPVFVAFLIVLLSFAVAWQFDAIRNKNREFLLAGLENPEDAGIRELLEKTKDDVAPTTWLEKQKYMLEQSGTNMTMQKFLFTSLGFAVSGFALSFMITSSPVMGLFFGMGAFFIPRFQVHTKRKKNIDTFNNLFRNTLIRMSSMLRAGASTKQAVLQVAQSVDQEEVVRKEFKRAYTDIEYGYTIEEAFMRMYYRTGSEDVRIVSIVMEIQRQKGGNLAELLDSIQQTITERQNQKRRIKTLTASQTSQANLLTFIPFGVFGFFMMYNPSYYQDFLNTPAGIIITSGSFGLIFFGNIIMRKMTSPK